MDNKYEKLNLFFENIKTLSFWQRIFGWGSVKALSYEAYSEFKKLLDAIDGTNKRTDELSNSTAILQSDNNHLKEKNNELMSESNILKERSSISESKINNLTASLSTKEETIRQSDKQINTQEKEIALLKEKISSLGTENVQYKEENAAFRQTENDRNIQYEKEKNTLTSIAERVQNERTEEINERQSKEIERIKKLKDTWLNHQDNVSNTIKMICHKLTIEYVEKPPFKGSPDNTIKICDEYVVFDAKSPATTDDLSNFPAYIKAQTESAKKYANQDSVRKDIFLVIPFNTIEVLGQFVYNMADYNVYIVSLDALEPLILSLKKIEEYEFIEQLSPEERENICRIIGKFAHMTKRRIQIDEFFMRQFIGILTKCESDLPKDIMDKIIEFEKQDKLNPPQEKRAKQISSKELIDDGQKIKKEAEAKSIVFPESIDKAIKSLPLYSNDEDKT